MKQNELLPCPFCGSKAEMMKYFNDYAVECTNIGNCISRLTASGCSRKEACKSWNTRAHIEEMRDSCKEQYMLGYENCKIEYREKLLEAEQENKVLRKPVDVEGLKKECRELFEFYEESQKQKDFRFKGGHKEVSMYNKGRNNTIKGAIDKIIDHLAKNYNITEDKT